MNLYLLASSMGRGGILKGCRIRDRETDKIRKKIVSQKSTFSRDFFYEWLLYLQGMNQYSSRSIQYPIPILGGKSKNTQYFNTFFAFWKYWKYQYQYQYPILSFSSETLILQYFLFDLHIFMCHLDAELKSKKK